LEAETNKYCPGGYDIGAISNLITWVLNFFFECRPAGNGSVEHKYLHQKGNTMDQMSTKTPNPECRIFLKSDQ
jgi:hypothetical protein